MSNQSDHNRNIDTPELQDGAPCSVQIITPTFKDEECLYAASIIDAVLNGA